VAYPCVSMCVCVCVCACAWRRCVHLTAAMKNSTADMYFCTASSYLLALSSSIACLAKSTAFCRCVTASASGSYTHTYTHVHTHILPLCECVCRRACGVGGWAVGKYLSHLGHGGDGPRPRRHTGTYRRTTTTCTRSTQACVRVPVCATEGERQSRPPKRPRRYDASRDVGDDAVTKLVTSSAARREKTRHGRWWPLREAMADEAERERQLERGRSMVRTGIPITKPPPPYPGLAPSRLVVLALTTDRGDPLT
jgi:hypothetical protein